MVREGQMRDVHLRFGHVAGGALVAVFRLALGRRPTAGLFVVALKTNAAVVLSPLLWLRETMRIVTRGAGERVRLLVAPAGMHLFDMPRDRHIFPLFLVPIVGDKVVPTQARAEILASLPANHGTGGAF